MKKSRIAAFAAAALMALNVGFSAKSAIYSPVTVNSVEAVAATTYTKNTEGFVRRMYNVVLGREPDAAGLKNWTAKLNNHTATASDLIYGFFWSGEYRGKKKSNDDIITDCYNAMLDRGPDASGRTTWLSRLDIGMTSLAVCKGFVGSNEFKNLCSSYGITPGTVTSPYARDDNYERTYFVYRLYQNCLGRTPDTPGLENWCMNLRNGLTGTKAAQGFIFSDEYKNQASMNNWFVEMLYETLLGRSADTSGLNSWTAQLDSGKSREYVTNGFLFSNEFKGQCARAGIALGSQISTPEQTDRYLAYSLEVVSLVNKYRAQNGLPALKVYAPLKNAAGKRTSEITNTFDHIRPNGSSCFSVLSEYGISWYSYAGENIAYGQSSPTAVMNAWMNSDGHRSNILSSDYEYIGVGVYMSNGRYYWVQEFLSV